MVMIGFGSKTAEKYIPNMKELILNGTKCQTGREWSEHWAKLKVGSKLQLYWKPRVKKQWEKLSGPPACLSNWRDIPCASNNLEHTEITYNTPDGHFKRIERWDTAEMPWFKQVGGCEFLGEAEVTETFPLGFKKLKKLATTTKTETIDMTVKSEYGAYNPAGRELAEDELENLALCDGFRDTSPELLKGKITANIAEGYKLKDFRPLAEQMIGKPYSQEKQLLGEIIKAEVKDDAIVISLRAYTAAEKMFKFFDETYGLETPKKFVFIRWKLC